MTARPPSRVAIDPRNRYASTPTLTFAFESRSVSWLAPRILPLPEQVPMTGRAVMPRAGERLDQLSTRVLGDPLSAWQLTDGNPSLDPLQFIEEHAHGVDVPVPRIPR